MSEYVYPRISAIVVECLLIALLVFTPLAFATVQTWAISVMEFACLAMVAVWLVGVAAEGPNVRFRFPLWAPVVLFVGLVVAQIVPQFAGVPPGLRNENPFLDFSTTNFFSTKTAFVKLLCYVGLYVCLVNTLTSPRQTTRVLIAVVVIGFAVSFLGLLQRISGTEKVFWAVKVRPGKTGFMATFINENHFAGYMELIIPITVAFVLRFLLRMKETGWRGVLASSDLHKGIVLSFLAILMIVSLAVSRSRGGLVGFLSSCVLMGILLLCRRFHRKKAWVITVLLVLSFSMLAWIGLKDLLKTWGTLGHLPTDQSFKRRMEIVEATWRGSKDYPVWGSGLGTFETVFPNYGTLRYIRLSRDRAILQTTPHAENDYVQTLLETGWVGLSICLLGAGFFLATAIRTYLTRRRRSLSMPAMGGAVSVFAILVHSFSDFNMRIDANVFLIVTITALVMSLSRVRHHDHHEEGPLPSRPISGGRRTTGVNRWAVVAIPLMLCLVVMEAVVRQFAADRAFSSATKRFAQYEQLCGKGMEEGFSRMASLEGRLKKMVRLEPRCSEYRSYLGRYYQALATAPSISETRRMELKTNAMREYETAVSLDPLNGAHLAYLAWMQGVVGNHEKAVENFEKAIRLNRTNEWIWDVYDAYKEGLGSGAEIPGPGTIR